MATKTIPLFLLPDISKAKRKCGCTLLREDDAITFAYCKLHAAAPALLEALDWAMAVIEDNFDASLDGGMLFHNARIEAIEAIAQAKEVPAHA